MSDTRFTPQQQRAIDARTHDILVSASAGAGKTTVLVDRVIKMLKEDPNLNIDQLLMVTFTNEAADNMRERIRRRLEKRGQQPSSARSDQPAGDCPHQYDSCLLPTADQALLLLD